MDAKQAAEVLRGEVWHGDGEMSEARAMGAESLELLAWWFDEQNGAGREAVQRKRDGSTRDWSVERWKDEIRAARKAGA